MPAPGRLHRSSGGASATPVGGPSRATSSGTVVAADGGLETVHRFMLCGRSYFRQTEIPETLRCWFRWLLTPTVLSCNVSEIKRNTARKSRFLYPLLNKNLLMKRAGIFLRFSFWPSKQMSGRSGRINRFWKTFTQLTRATDRQTDRQTEEKVISIAEGFFSETLAKNIDENY